MGRGRFHSARMAVFQAKRCTRASYYQVRKNSERGVCNLQEMLDKLKQGKMVFGSKQKTVEQYLTHWLENEHRLEVELRHFKHMSIFRVHLSQSSGICGWIRCPVTDTGALCGVVR